MRNSSDCTNSSSYRYHIVYDERPENEQYGIYLYNLHEKKLAFYIPKGWDKNFPDGKPVECRDFRAIIALFDRNGQSNRVFSD